MAIKLGDELIEEFEMIQFGPYDLVITIFLSNGEKLFGEVKTKAELDQLEKRYSKVLDTNSKEVIQIPKKTEELKRPTLHFRTKKSGR